MSAAPACGRIGVGTDILRVRRLFAAAPLPSAQLFEAAGLARVRLRHLVAAFFVGRLVSYSICVTAASAGHRSLSRVFAKGFFSPQTIVTEVLSIALLVATLLIDWPTVIDKLRGWWAVRRGRPAPAPIATRPRRPPGR